MGRLRLTASPLCRSAGQEGLLSHELRVDHSTNRLLALLSPVTLAALDPAFKVVSAPRGTVFLEAGEAIERIYFPLTGMISLLVLTEEGDMIETSTIGREGAVGLHRGLGERRSFTRATVQVPGRFCMINALPFEKMSLDNPDLREMIALYTEVLWAESQQIAACNARHDASARLCRWLLQTADRIYSDELPLTQEFLAQMLGVRRTTVTLLAQELQKKGAITYSRGKIVIVDRAILESCTCECYRVIQQEKLPRKIGIGL